MDKNTIWAIVLSTLVIIASYLILPKFFPGLNMIGMGNKADAQVQTEVTAEPQEFSLDNSSAELNEPLTLEFARDGKITITNPWSTLRYKKNDGK